jgi:hypothetical protein
MPMWRCPHCGTPQAETARCWVCRRSSTACGTCRHFRRAVAANLGYCGLDAGRQPLVGDEIRACWEAGAPAPTDDDGARIPVIPPAGGSGSRPRLEFVELEPARPARRSSSAVERLRPPSTTPSHDRLEPIELEPTEPLGPPEVRWSLWGDLER